MKQLVNTVHYIGPARSVVFLHVADEKKLQEMVDETKALEALKYDDLIAANKDEIIRLQTDNESLQRVSYMLVCKHCIKWNK